MDIVLEVFDTFLFDAVWATVYPGSPSHPSLKNSQNAASATFSSMREVATARPKPSTQFFQLEPSKYAYMSAWPRDNICRQGITLYLITWYAAFVYHGIEVLNELV
jgi:lathosterol oxidase